MKREIYYTALGTFQIRKEAHKGKYPVIIVCQKEHIVDPQEFAVWSILCWRICSAEELSMQYADIAAFLPVERRSLELCVKRLEMRGLIAYGTGDTEFEALYDLIGNLYVAPVKESLALRLRAFFQLVFLSGVSIRKAAGLFHHDRRDKHETLVMALSNQAMLSTAELIKCVEVGAEDISTDEKLLDALYYDEDTTSDNIAMMMLASASRKPVTEAVANLYLRKQIVFERV